MPRSKTEWTQVHGMRVIYWWIRSYLENIKICGFGKYTNCKYTYLDGVENLK